MDDDGAVGAQAAAVYFLELDSYMQAGGDTAEWEAMSHATCDFCADRLKQAERIKSGGYTWTGGEITITITHAYAQDGPTGIWPIDIMVKSTPAAVTDSAGATVSKFPASTEPRRVEVARRNGQWTVVELGAIPAG